MTLERHTMSVDQLTAFAQGRASVAAARRLVTVRLSKTALLIREIRRLTIHMRHKHADLVCQAYSALAGVQHSAPGAVRAVLEYPAVGAWALRCALTLRGNGDEAVARPAELAAIAAAAAVRGSVPMTIPLLPYQDSAVWLPTLGTVLVAEAVEEATLRSSPDGAILDAGDRIVAIAPDPGSDEPSWRGTPRISCDAGDRRLDLWLDGNVPRALPVELTPVGGLTDPGEVALWEEKLTAGWRLLTREHPRVADEVGAVIRVIAPLARRPADPASATLGDSFGAIVMSLPADAVLAAVTLAHETRHALLTGLMDLFPLVDSASKALFYAPWREDPRPAVGLLHGIYAHLGVAAFWRRQRWMPTPDENRALHAHTQFARWSAACREAIDTLVASGLLTPPGETFVHAMSRQLDQWCDEALPARAVSLARAEADEHRSRWLERR